MIKKLVILLVVLGAFSACKQKADKTQLSDQVVVMEMSIEGMTCNGCVGTVEASVRQMGDGITSVKANLDSANAIVEYIPSQVKPKDIKKAIEVNGYKVLKMEEK